MAKNVKKVVLAADYPVHLLPGYESGRQGHHATWLPPVAEALGEMADPNWEIHWMTLTKEVQQEVEVEAWGQTFHLLPRRKLSVEILGGFRRERSLMARSVQRIRADLFHGWGTEQGYGFGANDFSGKSIVSMQGILGVYCQAATMPWLTRWQARNEAKVLGKIKHLTVESPWGLEHLKRMAPQAEIRLLEYGVPAECHQTMREPAEKPLALFVGSPNRLKGVDTLLKAFRDSRLAGVTLVVLGRADLATMSDASGNVEFAGHVVPNEVRKWMSRAWCLVHPTRADTSPNCVKEARVMGVPVVTTPEGGQTQYIEHGASGWIHQAGDSEGLIEGVLACTRSQQRSLEMGKSGQENARQVLTAKRTAARLLEIYCELLNPPTPPSLQQSRFTT